jgi:hypothetical protein
MKINYLFFRWCADLRDSGRDNGLGSHAVVVAPETGPSARSYRDPHRFDQFFFRRTVS